MLSWPKKATQALRVLFAPLQDIDIYVEDSDYEAFYPTLLRRIVPEHVRIRRVFPLDGRDNLLREAPSIKLKEPQALFIVDGDFDLVRGDPRPKIDGLIRLNVYCIENLLICEKAISKILSEELNISLEVAYKRLGFQKWTKELEEPLVQLFAAYALSNLHLPSRPTISRGIDKMCHPRRKKIHLKFAPELVQNHINEIRCELSKKIGSEKTDKLFKTILSRSEGRSRPLDTVSGKSILLPLLLIHLQKLSCNIKKTTLRNRLASFCSTEGLDDLAKNLETAAKEARSRVRN